MLINILKTPMIIMPIVMSNNQLKNPPAANIARNPTPADANTNIKTITTNATIPDKHPEHPGLSII